MYTILFMTQAQEDAKKLGGRRLKEKALGLIDIIKEDPCKYPPDFEYLKGDLKGLITRRINKQYRLVYEVIEDERIIKKSTVCGRIMNSIPHH